MKRIKLSQGKFALVDNEDFDWLNQFKWYALHCNHTYYVYRNIKKPNGKWSTITMHKEIMKPRKGIEIDHRNHIGFDNQRANLRPCTRSQNNQNSQKRKNCSSKYKGVHWSKALNKWNAMICPPGTGKSAHLGYFDNEENAAIAYNVKAKELFGEYALPNQIERPKCQ